MDRTYWHKQTADKPLYPDLLWSRPENKRAAGKLLIIGGNVHGFAAPAEAYAEAGQAGAGSMRVLLPDVLQKTVGSVFPAAEFARSTPAGSFAQTALAEALEHAAWADATLLAGDLGRNSETAIFVEKFLTKHSGPVILTKDVADDAINIPKSLLARPDTLLVFSLAQLQKLFANAAMPAAITFSMDLLQLVDRLHDFTEKHRCEMVVKHVDHLYTAVQGQVSTTPIDLDNEETWRVKTAAHAAVWRLQNPGKPFEALTTSLITE